MASKYVPPSEDGRFEHRKMKDMDISSDDEKLPIDDDGNVDWVKYYQKNTRFPSKCPWMKMTIY